MALQGGMARREAGSMQRFWEEPVGGSLSEAGVFCRSFQSDFTNEMDKYYEIDRAGSDGHRVLCFLKLPSMAIFPWVIDHFIREITDCTQ